MPLLVPVMVRGINNLSDARYCAGMGADLLTFRLDPAFPDYLTPAAVQELSGWVAGVQLLGEFDALPVEAINELVAQCGLHAVLLHQPRPAAELAQLAVPAYLLGNWAAGLRAGDGAIRLQQPAPPYQGFVLATPPQPRPAAPELTSFLEQLRGYPVWLGAGFFPTNLRAFVEALRPAGIVLQGGDEIRPGLRNFDAMEAVFEELEGD